MKKHYIIKITHSLETVNSDRHGPSSGTGWEIVAFWRTTAVCAWMMPFTEDPVIIETLVSPKCCPPCVHMWL